MIIFKIEKGDLGFVPKKTDHIYTNFEKMKFLHPQRELGNLQKLTKKSVATQTIDFTKVSNNCEFKKRKFILWI